MVYLAQYSALGSEIGRFNKQTYFEHLPPSMVGIRYAEMNNTVLTAEEDSLVREGGEKWMK